MFPRRLSLLLACGVLSSALYVVGDIAAASRYDGYSYLDQAVSELSAIGAPTRDFLTRIYIIYDLLLIAFGWGVWTAGRRIRALRLTGMLILAMGVFSLLMPFPMNMRGSATSATDIMHIIVTAVTVLLFLAAMTVASTAFGRRFKIYSIVTIASVVVFAALTSLLAPGIAANERTSWMGLLERISIAAYLLWIVVLAARVRMTQQRETPQRRTSTETLRVDGYVAPGFDRVGDAFVENFSRRAELGGACCVYLHGQKVVDLWGGLRNKRTGEPWERDTMVLVYSTTKGLAAMTMALAHSRGWFDYEERVSTYWPEFARNGKERITVRQLLAHQAGLFALDVPIDRTLVADLDRLAEVLARQTPVWEPGTRQAYHAMTLGFYESELLRRVDPKHRPLGQIFQEEIANPLGLDVYIRLPESIPTERLATITSPSWAERLAGFSLRLFLEAINRRSNISRALTGSQLPLDEQRIYARGLEIPSGGGVGTARGIARAYSAFATGGHELALRRETLDLLAASAVPPARGFYDECFKGDGAHFSLGFLKPCPAWPLGSPSAYGSPGFGGSLGFADPAAGVGYAYVTNRMGARVFGDPRELALRTALASVLAASRPTPSLRVA